jgi:hypothetical protein
MILYANCYPTDATDQKKVIQAMERLMYDVGTPITNSTKRKNCVVFRPRQPTDKIYVEIEYGTGCGALVSIRMKIVIMRQTPFLCWCQVGYPSKPNSFVILQQDGCIYSSIIQHELLHVLGW